MPWTIKRMDEDSPDLTDALAEGWEPFAVVREHRKRTDAYGRVEQRWMQTVIWLRKQTKAAMDNPLCVCGAPKSAHEPLRYADPFFTGHDFTPRQDDFTVPLDHVLCAPCGHPKRVHNASGCVECPCSGFIAGIAHGADA